MSAPLLSPRGPLLSCRASVPTRRRSRQPRASISACRPGPVPATKTPAVFLRSRSSGPDLPAPSASSVAFSCSIPRLGVRVRLLLLWLLCISLMLRLDISWVFFAGCLRSRSLRHLSCPRPSVAFSHDIYIHADDRV